MATLGRRRALGQHFLKDVTIAQKIADAGLENAVESGAHSLLEIGPGKGAITHLILEKLAKFPKIEEFTLVERDEKLVTYWKSEITKLSIPVSIESGDFLDLPEPNWLRKTPVAVVSNLPYSAGTAILTRMAKHFREIPVMVLMFQSEVAKRLRAKPSTKERGSLSVWIQNRWDVSQFLEVPPRAFLPPPEVNSEVVILKSRATPQIQMDSDPDSEVLWEKLLKSCFAQRRKMLRSVIPWRNALELSGVDGTKRAEALGWQEWNSLYQAVRRLH